MIPNDLPPNSPSPATAEISCQGANKLEKNTLLMNFFYFYEEDQKVPGLGGLQRGPHENYSSRFPDGGPKRGSPTMTTSTITAGRKGDQQH